MIPSIINKWSSSLQLLIQTLHMYCILHSRKMSSNTSIIITITLILSFSGIQARVLNNLSADIYANGNCKNILFASSNHRVRGGFLTGVEESLCKWLTTVSTDGDCVGIESSEGFVEKTPNPVPPPPRPSSGSRPLAYM